MRPPFTRVFTSPSSERGMRCAHGYLGVHLL